VSLKAIVFDFDGTLLESAKIKTDAFFELFSDHPQHLHQIMAYHHAHEGVSRFVKFRTIYRDILKRPLGQTEENRLGVAFSRLIADKITQCPFVPGAQAFLESVVGQYKCFIASGTPHEELRALVIRRGIAKFFDEIHGAPQSKAEILHDILGRYKVVPTEVLSIGDATSDLEAACAEHVPFAGRVREEETVTFPPGSTVALFRDYGELTKEWSAILARVAVL